METEIEEKEMRYRELLDVACKFMDEGKVLNAQGNKAKAQLCWQKALEYLEQAKAIKDTPDVNKLIDLCKAEIESLE